MSKLQRRVASLEVPPTALGAEGGSCLPDPCDIAGSWTETCALTCPGAAEYGIPPSSTFTVAPELAAFGGVSPGGYLLDVATCKAARIDDGGPCGDMTSTYDFANGVHKRRVWRYQDGACVETCTETCTLARSCPTDEDTSTTGVRQAPAIDRSGILFPIHETRKIGEGVSSRASD